MTVLSFAVPIMGFSDMERTFYATDSSVFLTTRHNVIFPDSADFVRFAAYLTTDLIQPGIINVVRDFNADVSLAPASVSLYLAGGMALQWLLGPLSDRIGRRPVLIAGALIFTLACAATLLTTSMTQFLVARFVQGTSILLYRNGRLRHGTGGLRSNQSH
nr:sugar transport protein [Salmonella sp. NCTC 7297]